MSLCLPKSAGPPTPPFAFFRPLDQKVGKPTVLSKKGGHSGRKICRPQAPVADLRVGNLRLRGSSLPPPKKKEGQKGALLKDLVFRPWDQKVGKPTPATHPQPPPPPKPLGAWAGQSFRAQRKISARISKRRKGLSVPILRANWSPGAQYTRHKHIYIYGYGSKLRTPSEHPNPH